MKPNTKMLFGNMFDDPEISPNYLARFADDSIAKLNQNNATKEFDSILIPLQVAIIPLRSELGQVDTSFNLQVGKTAIVDLFINDFASYMKDNYVFIAAAMGGEKATELKEFYPKGKSEYSKITKTKIDTVLSRLKNLGTTHKTKLGPVLSTKLQNFQSDWVILRKSQLQQKSEVKTNRTERTVARRNLEVALLKAIHFIAQKYPADVQKCQMFFDFHLLFGVHHKSSTANDNDEDDY